jgi:hypothetical protein
MRNLQLDRVLVLSFVSLASLACGPGGATTTDFGDTGDTGTAGDGDGDEDADQGTTIMTGDGDGDGDGDQGDGDGDGDGDVVEPWLLSVKNQTHELLKVNTADATSVVLCQLNTMDNYPSITFGLDGVLYGSNNTDQALDIIDPCTCEIMQLGPTNFGGIPGITANGLEVQNLFGVSVTADVLLTLSTIDGAGTEIGPLGVDFHFSGTTWSSDIQGLYAINDTTNTLYTLDTSLGTANPIAPLDTQFSSVGIEWHPDTGELYACTNFGGMGSRLYVVDPNDATTTLIGDLGYVCNNLAAPWTTVSCVDDVPFN